MDTPRRTLIVGVGSPIRGDDGLGPALAEAVAAMATGAVVDWMAFDGSALDLLGIFAQPPGYDCAAVIDCVTGGSPPVGEVARLHLPDDGWPEDGWTSSHHAGIRETLAMARRMAVALPPDLRFYGVGVADATAFREGLSPALQARMPALARAVAGDLGW
jgi:hydrogenase maturation protease